MGGAVFPPCYLPGSKLWWPLMKIMAFKRLHACTGTLSAPSSVGGNCWPTPLGETPGHSQASLNQSLVWSLLLPPGSWCTQGSICAFQEPISSVLCKFWQLYGGVNGQPPSRGLMPYPSLLHPEPLPLQQSTADPYLHRRHSDTVLSQSLWVSGSWCTQGLFEPSEHLWRVCGLILNVISPLLPSHWGFSFALGCEISPQVTPAPHGCFG